MWKLKNDRRYLPENSEASSNSSIIHLQERRGCKMVKQLLEKSFSKSN